MMCVTSEPRPTFLFPFVKWIPDRTTRSRIIEAQDEKIPAPETVSEDLPAWIHFNYFGAIIYTPQLTRVGGGAFSSQIIEFPLSIKGKKNFKLRNVTITKPVIFSEVYWKKKKGNDCFEKFCWFSLDPCSSLVLDNLKHILVSFRKFSIDRKNNQKCWEIERTQKIASSNSPISQQSKGLKG